MTKINAIKIAAEFFKQHPNRDKLFVTSDEYVFFKENHAYHHARELDKKNPIVIEVLRGEKAEPAKEPATEVGGNKVVDSGNTGEGGKVDEGGKSNAAPKKVEKVKTANPAKEKATGSKKQ